jgi:hypothetical protein
MFEFVYKGESDFNVPKPMFETFMKTLFADLKQLFKAQWSPKKIIVTMHVNPKMDRMIGGTTNKPSKFRYVLDLFLNGIEKPKQTKKVIDELLNYTATHEMFHFFMPYVHTNSCWSEGVTDFMTFWFRNKLEKEVPLQLKQYNEITDAQYKKHRRGYAMGLNKMFELYKKNPNVIVDIKQMVFDYLSDITSVTRAYSAKDVIKYNPLFKTFFGSNACVHYVYG